MLPRTLLPLLLLAATCSARSVIEAEYYDASALPEGASSPQEESRGWQTWGAVKSWFSPVTSYISDKLPEKTPTELMHDVRTAASDLGDQVAAHPVVEGVNDNVFQPAKNWVQDTASSLSKRTFRDMYDSAVENVKQADENVADWIGREASETAILQ